jgi:hypothetical protein
MLETCAQNFARKGDPWLTERERNELQASLAPERGGRKYAKPKMEWRDRQRIAREYTEEEKRQLKVTENLKAIKQLVGAEPRTLTPLGPEALPLLRRVYHPMNEELNPFDRDFDADERRYREFMEAKRAENAKIRENR